jgi:ATP phosphoribosyltransferase regulatory subunit
MRDFAPQATAARRRIAETLLGVFERWGFARVITPAFEYEDVLALGLGGAGRAAAIRFVEPSSGQVVALRPDITPQIARLIATRFREETGAVRLCYEGTVVRLERGARGQRELIQAGVELAGVTGPQGDAEVIALGAAALQEAGLGRPTIDLGHLGLAREVLDAVDLPSSDRARARRCIGKRDGTGLEAVLASARGSKAAVNFAALLPELSGPPSILAAARKKAPTPGVRRALADLQAIVDALGGRQVKARVHVDLGEVRGFDYYTGVRVQGFVEGAPDAVLKGGRYDDLLGRYGRPSPAVGFAIDVEAAAGALEARARGDSGTSGGGDGGPLIGDGNGIGVLVVGPVVLALRTAEELRAVGKRAVAELCGLQGAELAAYARRWGFSEIVRVKGIREQGARIRRGAGASRREEQE